MLEQNFFLPMRPVPRSANHWPQSSHAPSTISSVCRHAMCIFMFMVWYVHAYATWQIWRHFIHWKVFFVRPIYFEARRREGNEKVKLDVEKRHAQGDGS